MKKGYGRTPLKNDDMLLYIPLGLLWSYLAEKYYPLSKGLSITALTSIILYVTSQLKMSF